MIPYYFLFFNQIQCVESTKLNFDPRHPRAMSTEIRLAYLKQNFLEEKFTHYVHLIFNFCSCFGFKVPKVNLCQIPLPLLEIWYEDVPHSTRVFVMNIILA